VLARTAAIRSISALIVFSCLYAGIITLTSIYLNVYNTNKVFKYY
jgi:hypothetical protein